MDQVKSQVLATFPLPNLGEAYSQVCHEVQRQVTMDTKGNLKALTLII